MRALLLTVLLTASVPCYALVGATIERLSRELFESFLIIESQDGVEWKWDWSTWTTCMNITQGVFGYRHFMTGGDARSVQHWIYMDEVPLNGFPNGIWDYVEPNAWSDPPYNPAYPLTPRWVGWNFSVAPGNYTWQLALDNDYIISSGCMFVTPIIDDEEED